MSLVKSVQVSAPYKSTDMTRTWYSRTLVCTARSLDRQIFQSEPMTEEANQILHVTSGRQ